MLISRESRSTLAAHVHINCRRERRILIRHSYTSAPIAQPARRGMSRITRMPTSSNAAISIGRDRGQDAQLCDPRTLAPKARDAYTYANLTVHEGIAISIPTHRHIRLKQSAIETTITFQFPSKTSRTQIAHILITLSEIHTTHSRSRYKAPPSDLHTQSI